MISPNPTPSQPPIVIDYAVNGPRTAAVVARGTARLVGMSYLIPGGEPCFMTDGLADILRGFGSRPRVYHDSVFGLAIEMKNDLPLPEEFEDTRIMLRLLDEAAPSELDDPSPRRQRAPADHESDSSTRVQQVWAFYQRLAPRIDGEGLDVAYQGIECPVIPPTLAMTLSGVRVNPAVLERIKESLTVQLEIGERQLWEIAGRQINLDAPQEITQLLYQDLGLPVTSYTRSGEPSAGKHALQQLAKLHPAAGIIIKYRQDKSIRDAAATLLAHTDPSSQMVYPELDPLGAATGRFSCSNANFQGLPGPVLEAVEARPGCVLMEADISQCELRVLAHFSRDPRLLEAYQGNDVDVHRRTAAAVLGIPEHQVAAEQRDRYGKRINFGIIFGETPIGLSPDLGVTVDEAERLLNAYFTSHPGVRQWIDTVHKSVQNDGEVRTLSGRRRRFPDVWSAAPAVASRALRQAVNAIIQGTAADLIKLALVRLHVVLPAEVRILMMVHDSVLLEVPEGLVTETRQQVIESMQTLPPGFTVPITAEVKTGRTWAACKTGEVGCPAAA